MIIEYGDEFVTDAVDEDGDDDSSDENVSEAAGENR